MAKRKYDFDEKDKVKALLWCDRHCCLCGKATGVGIEIAHLIKNSSDFDNAMPLCFDCHAQVGHYNVEHPRGKKYSIAELKSRRNQIYEQYTRRLVPPVTYRLKQNGAKLPDVKFDISNIGNTYHVQARVKLTIAQGQRSSAMTNCGHYDGNYLWNLNPGLGVGGHFSLPSDVFQENDTTPLRVRVDITLIDIYQRPHSLLPVGYILDSPHIKPLANEWYLEPAEQALSIPLGENV